MKTFITLILFFFTASNCPEEQNAVSSITYETFTRGSSTVYKFTPDSLKVISKGLNASEKSEDLSFHDWTALLLHLQKVKVSKINQLKAPSDARSSDATPHAILSIRRNDTIYKTGSFDHGNAPGEVKPLIQAILRLAENVE